MTMTTTTVRINGVEQAMVAEGVLFEEFVRDLNEALKDEKKVIASIRIDGKEITETEEAAMKGRRISELGVIDVAISSPADLAYETLDTLDQYLDRLTASIERAAMNYQAKNLLGGDSYFTKAIDGLDLFVQTLSGIKLALRIGLNTKIALAEASLVSIMNDLLEAKRQNNYVFLAELLEKDLVENLREWKNEIFPLFRNWKVS